MSSTRAGEPPDDDQRVAVVDIDGVLADVRHRLHHLASRPKDWDAFFAAAVRDPPLHEGFAVARELAAAHELVYLSGRPERTRSQTEQWLRTHGAPPGTVVLRPEGDRRPARSVKLRELRRVLAGRGVVVLVDDDPAVCTAAREADIPVLEADWAGDHAGTLFSAQEQDGAT